MMMTASISNEIALFDMGQEKAVAKKGVRKASSKKEEVRTPTGENARDIISAWVVATRDSTGVPIPKTVIGHLSRKVKSLISSGYQTNAIKNGLIIWTVRFMDNPLISPESLERLTWKLVMDQSPDGRRFQAELKTAVARFHGHSTAVTSNQTPAERRAMENEHAKADWRTQLAARQRLEDEI